MLDGRRILVVDDSPTVRAELRILLGKNGVDVVEAGSEFGMLGSIEQYGRLVDLIIMDVSLKFENGLDLVRRIRENERYSEIPVMILSEHASKEYVLWAKELGVIEYYRKPIEPKPFIEKLENVFRTTVRGD